MKKTVKVGLVQMHSGDNVEVNINKGKQGIRELASKGAQVICLPELFNAPYFCQERDDQYFALAEPVPGPTTDILGAVAADCKVASDYFTFRKSREILQHRHCYRCERTTYWQISQDAYS